MPDFYINEIKQVTSSDTFPRKLLGILSKCSFSKLKHSKTNGNSFKVSMVVQTSAHCIRRIRYKINKHSEEDTGFLAVMHLQIFFKTGEIDEDH